MAAFTLEGEENLPSFNSFKRRSKASPKCSDKLLNLNIRVSFSSPLQSEPISRNAEKAPVTKRSEDRNEE